MHNHSGAYTKGISQAAFALAKQLLLRIKRRCARNCPYDNLNRLLSVANSNSAATIISSYTYELNNAGIRTAVVEADGSRADYSFDKLYRLTGETRTGTNAYSIDTTWLTDHLDGIHKTKCR